MGAWRRMGLFALRFPGPEKSTVYADTREDLLVYLLQQPYRSGEVDVRFSCFSFAESARPCTYWSDGRHVVSDTGVCRCDRRFAVVERVREATR